MSADRILIRVVSQQHSRLGVSTLKFISLPSDATIAHVQVIVRHALEVGKHEAIFLFHNRRVLCATDCLAALPRVKGIVEIAFSKENAFG